MTLQNIKLPPIVIASLYKNCLVDVYKREKTISKENDKIAFLGGSNKHILLLVNNLNVAFLPDNQLNFLLGILSACKLNMANIAIVNLNRTEAEDRKSLPELFKAEVVMLFGIEAQVLGLPFKIPDFQVQLFKNQKYLFGPALDMIERDIDQKKKLWEALKNIFLI